MSQMLSVPLPELVANADWSAHPKKRWICIAFKRQDELFQITMPHPVEDLPSLIVGLRSRIRKEARLLLGFDFPIGLPLQYARRCGIDRFLDWLPKAGIGEWSEFFHPALHPDQIGMKRPFYPLKPGHTSQSHLISGLGMNSINDLRRQCELPHPGRRAAASLFWTLGGQQVGKAAISGWREILQPALQGSAGIDPGLVHVWPFSGRLEALRFPGSTILVETYPAECYNPLGVSFQANTRSPGSRWGGVRSGKRSQTARAANAGPLLTWAERSGVLIEKDLSESITDGFGKSKTAEDAFDSLIGLMGMLNVLLGFHPLGEPPAGPIREIEGWIFGQGFVD
jgi:hypothetical protein